MVLADIGGSTLTVPHDISGLIAWTRRNAWRDALAAWIDRHAAKTRAAAGEPARNAVFGFTIWKRRYDFV